MRKPEDLDLLLQALLTRFFTIRTRQPASGSVTFAQMRLVWTLEQQGSAPLTRVAAMLGVSNSTATELSDRLVRSGHLKRESLPEDRRQTILSLTGRGRAMLKKFARLRRERFRRLMRDLSARDVGRLARALETAGAILGKCRED